MSPPANLTVWTEQMQRQTAPNPHPQDSDPTAQAPSPNSRRALTPRTSECDSIWRWAFTELVKVQQGYCSVEKSCLTV